jgi:DNA-binding SARP family transcriptional activator/predicted negative regulator of RcsB-dependent stress response
VLRGCPPTILGVATVGGSATAGVAGRSSALLSSLLAKPAAEAADAVVERHLELTGTLLGRDWVTLIEHVVDDDGMAPVGVAWRAGYALHHLGHLGDALRVVGYADRGQSGDADWARLAGVRASLAWARGDLESCRTSAEEALKYARVSGDPGAEASAWVASAMLAAFDGDRDLNLHSYKRALALAEEAGDLQTLERTWNNLGSRSLNEGRCTEALEHLQRGLDANERTGHLSGLAILRHNVSEALLGLGRLDEALIESDIARDLWTSLEAPSASVSWQLRGDVQLARGNATQAAMAFAHAARLAASEHIAEFHAGALAGEAVALVGTDPGRAATLAEEALRISPPVGHAMPVVAAGWVRLSASDAHGASALAERAVELATHHRDVPRLADALELGALARAGVDGRGGDQRVDAQLREAGDIWRDLGNPLRVLVNEIVVAHRRRDRLTETVARDELRSLGVHDDIWRVGGPLRAVARVPGADEIRVHVLGQFGVQLGGQAVPASGWPSRKARDVLRVLACRGDRGIGRERLGALVWPNADAVGNRLSVALSHVRSVLDPGRRLDDPVVVSDGGLVRLDLRHVSVDLVDFTEAARGALAAAKGGSPRAVTLLEGAAAMHTGELLEDADGVDRVDWLLAEREEVALLGREVLHTLAGLLAAGSEPAEALLWYARMLAHDPYDEATYSALVLLLVSLGRYGEARRHHRTYALRMDELGVPARGWDELAGG